MHKAIAKMWIESGAMMSLFVLIWTFYVYFAGGEPWSYTGASQVIAATGTLLFAASFALGPVSYFFDFLDRKVAYRKQLGLLGYFCALVYSFLLMFSDLDFYFDGFFRNFFTPDIFFGFWAMLIFTVMAAVSNITMMKKLGNGTWRNILRLGYIAYSFLVIRAIWIEWDLWMAWWEVGEGLPPIRVPLCIIAVTVIGFRTAMRVHYKLVKEKKDVLKKSVKKKNENRRTTA